MTQKTQRPEVKQVLKCRACDSKNITTFLELGPTPIPNGFIAKVDLSKPEKFYPLDVCFCSKCGMVQLSHVVDPQVMFGNYVYVPSTSTTMVRHFDGLAKDASKRVDLEPGNLVVDIGSNDGTLLKAFRSRGATILGIDPATNLAVLANEQGIPTINKFFTKKLAKLLRQQHGRAKIISATNVVAHVDDLHDFFEGVNTLLDEGGQFVMEFPYLVNLIKGREFDTIYQEHLSYLSVSPLLGLLRQHGLNLVSPKLYRVHGGSMRVYATKGKAAEDKEIQRFVVKERREGMLKEETYLDFQRAVARVRNNLNEQLYRLRNLDMMVAGYGASAKGNILLNYCRIGRETIPFIVDSIPYKQGKFTPGTHIPILPEDQLLVRQPDVTLLLAWNFADEIVAKQKEYIKKGGRFVRPIPVLELIRPRKK